MFGYRIRNAVLTLAAVLEESDRETFAACLWYDVGIGNVVYGGCVRLSPRFDLEDKLSPTSSGIVGKPDAARCGGNRPEVSCRSARPLQDLFCQFL